MSLPKMKCHYEVMELDKTATSEEVKKQYKKLALKYHPDRNIGREVESTEYFKLISSAYQVLSDPHERQWYDDHRDQILRGGVGTEEYDENTINLWKYFNNSCFNSFDDSNGGFYSVYNSVFHEIYESEKETTSRKDFVSYGTSTSESSIVIQFYQYWTNFSSSRNFSWEDKYDIHQAPNRNVRRMIEKENQKLRDVAKKSYNDLVRKLAQYIKKRDPRIIKIEIDNSNKALEAEQRQIQLREELKAKRKVAREQNRQMYGNDEEELSKREIERERAFLLADHSDDGSDLSSEIQDVEDSVSIEGVTADISECILSDGKTRKGNEVKSNKSLYFYDVEDNEKRLQDLLKSPLRCVNVDNELNNEYENSDDSNECIKVYSCELCKKTFKTDGQLQQHEASKVHRKKLHEAEKLSKQKSTSQRSKSTEIQFENTPIANFSVQNTRQNNLVQVDGKAMPVECNVKNQDEVTAGKEARSVIGNARSKTEELQSSESLSEGNITLEKGIYRSECESEDSESDNDVYFGIRSRSKCNQLLNDSDDSSSDIEDAVNVKEMLREDLEERSKVINGDNKKDYLKRKVSLNANESFKSVLKPKVSGDGIKIVENITDGAGIILTCREVGCEWRGSSRNKLFQHLKSSGHALPAYCKSIDDLQGAKHKEIEVMLETPNASIGDNRESQVHDSATEMKKLQRKKVKRKVGLR